MSLKALEAALNRYLALDPESQGRLEALEGKTITIELASLSLSFQLLIQDQRIKVHAGKEHPAEVAIKGSPFSLISLGLSSDKKRRFLSDDLSLEGDAELGQQILGLFEKLDIDWEEYLSHYLGDIGSHQLGCLTRSLFAFGKKTKETLLQNTNEYIHEEKPWFPPREALDNFYQDVDELRLDLDRLEARMKHL